MRRTWAASCVSICVGMCSLNAPKCIYAVLNIRVFTSDHAGTYHKCSEYHTSGRSYEGPNVVVARWRGLIQYAFTQYNIMPFLWAIQRMLNKPVWKITAWSMVYAKFIPTRNVLRGFGWHCSIWNIVVTFAENRTVSTVVVRYAYNYILCRKGSTSFLLLTLPASHTHTNQMWFCCYALFPFRLIKWKYSIQCFMFLNCKW